MDLQNRLGQPVAPAVALPPLPLRFRALYAGSLFVGLGLVLAQTWTWLTEPADLSPQTLFVFLPFLLLAWCGGLNVYREYARGWEPALFEKGISLQRGSRHTTFRFDEVREAAIAERELLGNGKLTAIQRDVKLRSDAAGVVFRMRTLAGEPDHAAGFLAQLRAGLAEAAGQRLREGETLAGRGWRLAGASFHAGSLDVPFDTVAGAGLAGGGRVALWRVGEEKPFFTVPSRSTNALVLHDVLAERLPTHELGLGRFLFEKRARKLPAVLLGATALGSFAVAVKLYMEDGGLPPIAVTGIVCGVVLGAAAYLLAARGFRCYERGLVKFSPWGEQELRFSEVEKLSYQNSPVYYKNIYVGTTYSMTFHRREGGDLFKVNAHSRHADDPDLKRLRDCIATGRSPL
jgi:hypothetical protein